MVSTDEDKNRLRLTILKKLAPLRMLHGTTLLHATFMRALLFATSKFAHNFHKKTTLSDAAIVGSGLN